MVVLSAEQSVLVAVDRLWQVVSELVLTVLEDQPSGVDLAVLDDVAEQVVELQGDVAAAREMLRPGCSDGVLACLPDVSARIDSAGRRYWRRLRAYGPVAELRRAARRGGGELPAWQVSLEAGLERCEEPLVDCADAFHACWREVCRPLVPPTPRRPS